MVCDALSITNNCRLCLRRFYTFRATVGEFELAAILHVLLLKTVLNGGNYQLDRYFPGIHDASYRDNFADLVGRMDSPDYLPAPPGG